MSASKIQFNAPINNLSLGQVSVNFARELIRGNHLSSFFPQGDNFDLSAYDKLDQQVIGKLNLATRDRLKTFDQNVPTLKLWHINGSEYSYGSKRYLYTFYETDSPTIEEINLVKNQKAVFFSSSESCEIFKERGLDNVHYVPLGFDEDLILENSPRLDDDVIHFGLIGKLEKRKNTQRIIKLWLEKYGNNTKYQLTCLINNPFFRPEVYQQIIGQTLGGAHWNNVNLIPHLAKNSEVAQIYNAIDVDLSGLSNGEGWNLPSFNSTALGKWSVVSNCSSHKDWANSDNSVLVEVEDEKQDCYDDVFFKKGLPFNQGKFYSISDEAIIDGIERAEKLAKSDNENGKKLQKKFTYQKTINKILKEIK